jgi:hypothetical protein
LSGLGSTCMYPPMASLCTAPRLALRRSRLATSCVSTLLSFLHPALVCFYHLDLKTLFAFVPSLFDRLFCFHSSQHRSYHFSHTCLTVRDDEPSYMHLLQDGVGGLSVLLKERENMDNRNLVYVCVCTLCSQSLASSSNPGPYSSVQTARERPRRMKGMSVRCRPF